MDESLAEVAEILQALLPTVRLESRIALGELTITTDAKDIVPVIRALRGFRMKIFNTVGDTVVVNGKVRRKWREGKDALLEIEMWSENSKGVSVGPGSMVVTLPSRSV